MSVLLQPRSVVSIPDIHGDLGRLQAALQLANLTNGAHQWIAPPGTVVVQTGDLVDRGDEYRGIVALMQSVETQAAAAGSVVHRLLGNHEVMNLMGDLRYVTPGDFAAFGGHAARAAAFARDGPVGAWLLRAKVCVEVAGTIFVHGGIAPRYAALGCDSINARAADELARAVPSSRDAAGRRGGARLTRGGMLEDDKGPVWYRGLAEGGDPCEELRRSLAALGGAKRMVLGHTIQEDGRMRLKCGGALALTDVGMSRGYDRMLGRANRVAVFHALEWGANGTALAPHAEYPNPNPRAPPPPLAAGSASRSWVGRSASDAVEEGSSSLLGAAGGVAPPIVGQRRLRSSRRTSRRLRLAPRGGSDASQSMLEMMGPMPAGAIALGAAGDLMRGGPL